jgi:hypothetical protein
MQAIVVTNEAFYNKFGDGKLGLEHKNLKSST